MRLPAVQIDPALYPWISVGGITWGIIDCFFGYRLFKVTLALLGALVGALLAQFVAVQLGASQTIELVALLVGAIVGGLLAFLLYIAGVFVAGFAFGATLGMLLLANYHHMVALGTGLVLGIVGGFLAIKVQRVLIVLSTSLVGAFRAILALSFFTNQLDWLFYFRQPEQLPALIENNPWMFPSILALAVVGVIAQLELGGKPAAGKPKAGEK